MVTFWPVIEPASTDWTSLPSPVRGRFMAMAVRLLWRRSGRTFGLVERTVRPCIEQPGRPSTYRGAGGTGHDYFALWPLRSCGTCDGTPLCRCTGHSEVTLPGPVHKVTAVTIDGTPLPATAWKVRGRRQVMRVDGQAWPTVQNLDAPDDGPGAFVVTYIRGVPVPIDGQHAAGALAYELWKADNGQDCGLPENLRSVSRQGVSMEMVDMAALLGDQATGVPSVDRWIASVNPGKNQAPPRVFSPDQLRTRSLR